MTNKKEAAKVVAMSPQQENPLQQKLQKIHVLTEKTKALAKFQNHLDELSAFEVESAESDTIENPRSLSEITLKFGYNESYSVKSPALLEAVRLFLIDKLTVRKAEIEVQIKEATI